MQPRLVSNPGTSPSSPSCMLRVQMHTAMPRWQSFILRRIETYIRILFLTSLAQLSHFFSESCYDSHYPTVLRSSLTPRIIAISCFLLQTISELLVHSLLCFQVQIRIQYPVVLLPTQVERNLVQMPSYSVKNYITASSIACITSVFSLCFTLFIVCFPSLRSFLG